MPNYGYGFNCTVPVQAGTTVLLVGGDMRGIGSGGSEQMVVQQSGNRACLDSSSPSSTPGPPAGASPTSSSNVYPTSSGSVYPTSSSGVYPASSSRVGAGGGSGSSR